MENQSYKTSSEGNTYCIFFHWKKSREYISRRFYKNSTRDIIYFYSGWHIQLYYFDTLSFRNRKTRSFNIVIDEFQEFYNIRPDVFSDMQNLWDEYRQETKINLVISGSVYSLMQKIFTDHGEPLFGRADNILCLRSFNTKVLKQIMEDFAPGYSNDDLLALYTLTGGIPKYVELFCDNQALSVDRIYDFVFSENSLFIDEGRNLLITEFGKIMAFTFPSY